MLALVKTGTLMSGFKVLGYSDVGDPTVEGIIAGDHFKARNEFMN